MIICSKLSIVHYIINLYSVSSFLTIFLFEQFNDQFLEKMSRRTFVLKINTIQIFIPFKSKYNNDVSIKYNEIHLKTLYPRI